MLNIYICVGSACHMKGSYNIIHEMQHIIEEKQLGDKIIIKAALCLGKCTTAVSVRVDEEDEIISVVEGQVRSFFEEVVLKRLENKS